MKKLLLSSLLAFALVNGGCASIFKKKDPEPIYITKTETVYVTIPDGLIECPDPIVLTPEQIFEITSGRDNDEVDTEDLYNKYYVAPTAGSHEICWKSAQEVIKWNLEHKNKEEPNEP